MTKSKEVQSIQEKLKAELAGLKDRVEPPSGFAISTNGKVFTLPDGSSNPGPLTCIILDWVTANVYFKGLYNPKEIKPPVCFALSAMPVGMIPSDKAPEKQHETCSGCKQNEYKSAQNGIGKACKNTRRLIVVSPKADAETSVWVLTVSPTGLKHFDKYVNTLSDMGKHPIEITTEVSFDESQAFPTLRFASGIPHNNVELMWALKEQGQSILYQEPSVEAKAA